MNYNCNICNKDYASYQSLWIHKNKFHSNKKNNEKSEGKSDENLEEKLEENNKCKQYKCKLCNKVYNNRQSKYVHQKKCNGNNNDELSKLKDQINKLSIELKEIKTNNKATNNIINNNITNNNMTNSNNTINNNNTYNIIINKYGSENLFELTDHEMLDLLENNINNILYYLEFVNFNKKRPQNHSFCVTALNDRHISVIDNDTNKINKSSKKFAFDNLLIYGIKNITKLYNSNKNKIPYKKRQIIEDNIEKLKMYQKMPYNDYLKKQLIKNFNMLAYNKRDMVLKTWDNNREIIEDCNCENLFINQNEDNSDSSESDTVELKLVKPTKKYISNISDSNSSDESDKVELKLIKPTKKYISNISDSDSSISMKKNKQIKKYSSCTENEIIV